MKNFITFLLTAVILMAACNNPEKSGPVNDEHQMRGIAAIDQSSNRAADEVIVDKNLDTITFGSVAVEKSITVTYLVDSPTRKVSKYVKPSTPVEPPPVVVDPPVSGYQLIFESGFDRMTDITTNSEQWGNGTINTSNFVVGPGSFHSIPKEISQGFRSEVQYTNANQNPTEGAIEYNVYYDVLVASHGHSFQWHPYTSGASASPGLLHEGGKFTIMKFKSKAEGNQYIRTGVTIPTKRWIKLRWEFKFAKSGAYLRLYMDGKLIANDTSGWLGDGSGQYPKIGWNGFDKSTMSSRILYDQYKVFKKV